MIAKEQAIIKIAFPMLERGAVGTKGRHKQRLGYGDTVR